MSTLRRRPFVVAGVVCAAIAMPVLVAAQTVHASTAKKAPLHHRKRPKRASTGAAASQAGKSSAHRQATNSAARRSSDPGVTIADFLFSPGTITIHVGDTIVWTNNGPSAHTATANNGSFDTGVLQKGKSASVSFHNPGTFDYHCTIHPFMHGAVVVLASTKTTPTTKSTHPSSSPSTSNSSTPSSGSNTSPSGAPSTPSAGSNQATLPMTGVNVLALVLTGVLLTGAGLMLRRLHRG